MILWIPESQNSRKVEAGRDLWRSSYPIPLLREGHLEQVAQDRVQMAFKYLQGWRFHNFSGQPVLVLGHPCSKKLFSGFPARANVYISQNHRMVGVGRDLWRSCSPTLLFKAGSARTGCTGVYIYTLNVLINSLDINRIPNISLTS